MPPTIVVALTSFFALLGAVYVGWWQPIFTKLGDGREVRPVGNTGDCTTEPALKACESEYTCRSRSLADHHYLA